MSQARMFSEPEITNLMADGQYAVSNSQSGQTHDIKSALGDLRRLVPRPGMADFGSGAIAEQDKPIIQKCAFKLSAAIEAANAKGAINLPKKSVNFGADVSMTQSETDAGSLAEKPITIIARTSSTAYQGYWGRCVHDMNGFIPPDGPVILDWNHDPDTVIGATDSVSVVNGQLVAQARLTPFTTDDQASKVIFQGSKGVPFQASVVMNPDGLQTQQVPEGQTVNVNGIDFEGPGTVFRQWGISGIAILPYGADGDTSVQFSRSKSAAAKVERSRNSLTQAVAACWSRKA